MALARGTLLIFLSCCFSYSLAFECLTQYNSRCESCSKRIQCDQNLKENTEICYSEFDELCVELGSEAICSNLETSCKCSGRTGCYDDPYSSHYFIDCSYDIAVYSECPEGEVHDGKCGCTEGVAETNLEDLLSSYGTARCAFCPATPPCSPEYQLCGGGMSSSCSDPTLCFSNETCACGDPPPPACEYCEVPQPNDCSKFYVCNSTNQTPIGCIEGCFEALNCSCIIPPPTTTTVSTTPDLCAGMACTFSASPENGCEAYVDCYDPDVIQYCNPGECFDEVACNCYPSTVATTTTTVSTTTGQPVTTPPVSLPPSCANCNYYETTDVCAKAQSCTDPTAAPITCPRNMCYDDIACACISVAIREEDTTNESCDRCGLMVDPEGDCRSYYNCFDKTERFECNEGSCFDKYTCECTEI